MVERWFSGSRGIERTYRRRRQASQGKVQAQIQTFLWMCRGENEIKVEEKEDKVGGKDV